MNVPIVSKMSKRSYGNTFRATETILAIGTIEIAWIASKSIWTIVSDLMETPFRRWERLGRFKSSPECIGFKMAETSTCRGDLNFCLCTEEVQKYQCLFNKFDQDY